MNFELWICGFMFTFGLVVDDEDKWYHFALAFFLWPLFLGAAIRKVLEK